MLLYRASEFCSELASQESEVFGEFKLQQNCNINPAHQKKFHGLVEMTFGLVHASYSCKTDSLCTLRLVVCVASVSAQVNAQMRRSEKKTNGGEVSNFIAGSDLLCHNLPKNQTPVVLKVDNAITKIRLYLTDSSSQNRHYKLKHPASIV